MKMSFPKILAVGVLALGSMSASSAIITGGLSYDDTGTKLITGSNGKTYLGWAEVAGLTYTETLAETMSGGAYSDFHIASEVEAYDFFNLATGSVLPTGTPSYYAKLRDSGNCSFDCNPFGNSWEASDSDYISFLSSHDGVLGLMGVTNGDDHAEIWSQSWSLQFLDDHSHDADMNGRYNIGLLLVKSTSVSEPATISLLGLGLAGLGFARRRKQS